MRFAAVAFALLAFGCGENQLDPATNPSGSWQGHWDSTKTSATGVTSWSLELEGSQMSGSASFAGALCPAGKLTGHVDGRLFQGSIQTSKPRMTFNADLLRRKIIGSYDFATADGKVVDRGTFEIERQDGGIECADGGTDAGTSADGGG